MNANPSPAALDEEAVTSWLSSWFAQRGAASDKTASTHADTNYFEAGWIDSLQVIELISDTEKKFSVRFKDTHFQDRRFSTLGGLSRIIVEIQSGG